MDNLLQVGAIANTHGLKGEVKVFPTTDDPGRYRELQEVILDTGKQQLTMEIEGVRFFKNMVIVKFKGIDNINDVERYKGAGLFVTRENAVELGEDEYFVADLVGLCVKTDEGEMLGKLTDILQTGANDVYVVKLESGGELLVPAIRDCIRRVDLAAGEVTVHLLPGLLDVNRKAKNP